MKVPTFKPSDVPGELRRQLIRFQDDLNRVLSNLPFEYSQRLSVKFYPENLPMQISHNMPKPAWGLKPVYMRNLTDDAAYPTDGMYLDWIPESGGIKIRGINGLLAGNFYEIELVAYG